MNATPDKTKVIDRVRKLLNMSRDKADGGEHERDNALRMALKLIAKHNLEPDDYQDKPAREVYKLRIDICPWRTMVCDCIAKLFFTQVFRRQAGKQTFEITFVGAEGNAITAKEISHYIILSLQREAAKRRKEQFGDAKGYPSKWETSFLNGAAFKLVERCKALRAEAEAEAAAEANPTANSQATGTALTLASIYDKEKETNLAYIQGSMNIVLKKGKDFKTNNMSFDGNGFRNGQKHGETVSLNRQLT